jgi:hypothetical protein
MKTCFKCGLEKSIDDFYRHPQMADGHLGKCKACAKLDVKTHRATHESVREYDRKRAALPHRICLRTRITRDWRQTFRERARAQVIAGRAETEGVLKAPELCEGCGLKKRVEKHHPDYSRPLLVVWLCKPCHAIADKIRRRLEAS